MSKTICQPAPTFTSPLGAEIARFIQFKRSLGCRYYSEQYALQDLDRFLVGRLQAEDPIITLELIRAFVTKRANESETTRQHRLSLIRELCKFLSIDEPRTTIPPPRFLNIHRRPFLARVLTREEGRAFLRSCDGFAPGSGSPLKGIVHGTALKLIYLAGLRIGEALNLSLNDVDLAGQIMCIRQAKFGKSRLVPIAADMAAQMRDCQSATDDYCGVRQGEMPFFIGLRGERCARDSLRLSFRLILAGANIPWLGRGRGPRIHDLRHSFAVHRLLVWYEQDADLNAKLPLLATYLGHTGLASSQRYLQLTEDILGEVNRRFEARFGYLIADGNAL